MDATPSRRALLAMSAAAPFAVVPAALPAPVARDAEAEAWLAEFVAIGGTVHVFAAPDGSLACWLGCPVEAEAAGGMLHEIHATHPLRPRIGAVARALHLVGALPT
jgi:hypothetical protein